MQDQNISDLIAGQSFTDAEAAALEEQAIAAYTNHKTYLLADALTLDEASSRLGMHYEDLICLASESSILQVEDFFPSFQFDLTQPNGIVDGLGEVLPVLKISPYAQLNWLLKPNRYFENKTPVEMLKLGEKERVIAEAKCVLVI
jgi:hypothetical protein